MTDLATSTDHSKGGRPRLDSNPDFLRRFATVLPRWRAKEIGQGEAARELGISVRSFRRYVERLSLE
jgi:hypothetical protein